jgi:Flp pilus assembly protein TadG
MSDTTRRIGRRASDDRGAALVEFALIGPLVFALLFGVFTGGMSLSRKNSMTNAVREGARLGATLPEDAEWADKVRDRVVALAGGDLDPSQVCVELIIKPTAATETSRQATACTLDSALEPDTADVPVGECAVKVWAARESDLQVVFFSKTLDLTASSVNRYEREGDPATCEL